MLLSEVRQSVLSNIGDPDQHIWTNARLDRIINDVLQDLCNIIEGNDPSAGIRSPYAATKQHLLEFVVTATGAGTFYASVNEGETYPGAALPFDFKRIVSVQNVTTSTAPKEVMLVAPELASFYVSVSPGRVAFVTQRAFSNYATLQSAYVDSDLASSTQEGGVTCIYFPNLSYTFTVAGSYTYKFNVFFTARHKKLANDTDPIQLPYEYTHLLVLGSTVLALCADNNDPGYFAEKYEQGLQLLGFTLPRRDGKK